MLEAAKGMRDSFKSYRDLEVWQKGMSFAKYIYQVTSDFPVEERFGLMNQIRRVVQWDPLQK